MCLLEGLRSVTDIVAVTNSQQGDAAMKLLHLDSSILGENSVSRSVSAAVTEQLKSAHPDLQVTYRDLVAQPLDHLTLAALADPTRRSMLTQLAGGPTRVTDLAGPTGLRLPTVMRHLSVLEEAGLIATSKDGRIRTCAIVPEALDPVRTWLDEQRAIWEARLDRLDECDRSAPYLIRRVES